MYLITLNEIEKNSPQPTQHSFDAEYSLGGIVQLRRTAPASSEDSPTWEKRHSLGVVVTYDEVPDGLAQRLEQQFQEDDYVDPRELDRREDEVRAS